MGRQQGAVAATGRNCGAQGAYGQNLPCPRKNSWRVAPRGITRASANTSGSDFTVSKQPLVKLRTFEKDPHRSKKACFFCRTGFEDADAYRNTIQPFDLMSRRHPLPSIRAFSDRNSLDEANRPGTL